MIRRALLAAASVALFACQGGLGDPKPLASLDEPYFRCKVQPVLTKSCAAFACHGDARRFFNVFARNRLRAAGTEQGRNAQLTDLERAANFESARAMVDPGDVGSSWLLLKPLEAGAGGYFHRGGQIYGGGNVFATRDDPDFKVLEAWTQGAKEASACVEPGSDQ